MVKHPVPVDAAQLRGARILRDPVVIIERGLGAPAEMQRGGDVLLRPLHDLLKLLPVGDLLELQVLDRRAGDDHAVEVLPLHVPEFHVELVDVALRGVRGLVGAGL